MVAAIVLINVQRGEVNETAQRLLEIEGVAEVSQMTSQIAARGIAEAQFLDQVSIVQTALLQILDGLGMTLQLRLIEGRGSLE